MHGSLLEDLAVANFFVWIWWMQGLEMCVCVWTEADRWTDESALGWGTAGVRNQGLDALMRKLNEITNGMRHALHAAVLLFAT
jgi:hypothetical protein